MPGVLEVPGADRTFRITIDQLDQGWSTRSFPHLISERQLAVADNVVFSRDGLVCKRPGNAVYGGAAASGATGGGAPVIALARGYFGSPLAGQLIAQSGGALWRGNDATGAFTQIAGGFAQATPATFAQVYDPDYPGGGRIAMIVCDGSRVPMLYDGADAPIAVNTGASTPTGETAVTEWLPTRPDGSPIRPRYVIQWGYHAVYAGDDADPCGLWISDALRPQRFNGFALLDSAGTPYTAYYPAGRYGSLGPITGLAVIGAMLVVFFSDGIVTVANTGTAGAFEYVFTVISTSTGCPAPRSIVPFGGFALFFGGDRFYATDGQSVVPLPDEIPSVYAATSRSTFPCEMKSKTSVIGARSGLQYWASYDAIGAGPQSSIVVFDLSAAGGWTFGAPSGGAWTRWPTGMQLASAVECRGPGDTQQLFWGSSIEDQVAQFDVGTFDDFGADIAIEARAKAFFLDKPVSPKDVQALYVVAALQTSGPSYQDAVTAYVVTDAATSTAPQTAVGVTSGTQLYGAAKYGTFKYGSRDQIITTFAKSFPNQDAKGTIVQPGVIEKSQNPFNLIAFVVEVIVDEPV